MRRQTVKDLPWYLEPDALAIIAAITEKPDTQGGQRSETSAGKVEYSAVVYVGPEVAKLQRYWALRFKAIDAIRPWPEARMRAVLTCATEQDVLAALFGSPAGFPAFPETEAKWAGIREAIASAANELLARAA